MRYLSRARSLRLTCVLGVLALAGPAAAIDPALLPSDTEAVLTINFRQLLNSDLAKKNPDVMTQLKTTVEAQLADAGVQRYLQKLDFDLFRDLDTVTITTAGGKTPEFLLIEGKFSPEKMQATAEEAASENGDYIKTTKIAGIPVYEVRVDLNENPVYAGLIGQNKFIATHTKDAFAEAASRIKNKGGQSKLKKELRDVLAVTGKKTSLTAVSTGPALVKLTEDAPVPNIEALGGVLQGISALNVSLTVDKNVTFELVVNSKDKKSADEMAKLADLGVAGAKLMLKKKAETDAKIAPALDIVNTLRVTSQDNNVVLRGEVSAAVLGRIIKELPK